MRWEKENKQYDYLYHYTTKANAKKILSERKLSVQEDRFIFFATSVEDSKKLFFELMCREGASYYDSKMVLQKRIPSNIDDYVILQIPHKRDEYFYRFNVGKETENFSAYDYSIAHYGDYSFSYANELEMSLPTNESTIPSFDSFNLNNTESLITTYRSNQKKWRTLFEKSRKAVATVACGLIIGATTIGGPIVANAATPTTNWLDVGNFDDRWWPQVGAITLDGEIQFAGLAQIVNVGGNKVTNPLFFSGTSEPGVLDLSAHRWTLIETGYSGTLEGLHKIILCPADFDISPSVFVSGSTATSTPSAICTTFLDGDVSIDGDAKVGETISVNLSSMLPNAAKGDLSYLWQSANDLSSGSPTFINIPGATSSTFKVTPEYGSKQLRVLIRSNTPDIIANELNATIIIAAYDAKTGMDKNPANPPTGDSGNLALPFILIIASGLSLFIFTIKKHKGKAHTLF